jgi:hypothetical protein
VSEVVLWLASSRSLWTWREARRASCYTS